jgi:signal transduction histidine kinase
MPHNGIDALCEMLRASLQADLCLLALTDSQPSAEKPHSATAVHLCLADGSGGRSALGARLLLRADDGAVLYCRKSSKPVRTPSPRRDIDVGSNEARQRLAALADLLGVSSMMSAPLGEGEACIGRVYVGSSKERYTSQDISPLRRGARCAGSLIASIQLAERLAKETAFHERRRISRDLHDSAMQPYIAVKLGLEAMHRRLRGTELAGDLEELLRIASDGIGELRQYVVDLKKTEGQKQVASLLAAIRAQARKFSDFYGIDAHVIAQADIPVSAPLRNEVIQIVREGLSNIRRHTCAERATISLREAQGRLFVELINDTAREADRRKFYPRSIGERATELGGRVNVRHGAGNRTVVAVELPLHGGTL